MAKNICASKNHKSKHEKTHISKAGSNIYSRVASILFVTAVVIFGVHFLVASHAATVSINGTAVGIAASNSPNGYWIAASDGGVFAEGSAPFYGSMGGQKLSAPITSIASTADGKGYWLVGADGAVYAFGDAGYHNGVNNANVGGTSALIPGARITSMAVDPANGGYILIDNFGHSYAFGNAPPYNVSPWTTPTGENVNSLDMNSSGAGLYVLTTDGRVLSYGSVAGQGGYLGPTAGGQKWIGIASDPGTNGYYMVSNIGGVYAESGAAFYGSAVSNNPVGGIIGMAVTPDGKGYWLLGGDGGIFAYGDANYQGRVQVTNPGTPAPAPAAPTPAPAVSNVSAAKNGATLGSTTALANGTITSTVNGTVITASNSGAPAPSDPTVVKVTAPAVDIVPNSDNSGYYELTSDGGVFARGGAQFAGSAASNNVSNIVGMARPSGVSSGYYLAGSDGGVFAYGLPFEGSMGGKKLNAPVVGIAATPDGKGYWLTAADGGVFAFGDAGYFGSMGGKQLNSAVVGISATPDGKGYWLVAADGGIFAYGDANFYGSMGNKSLNKPVVGMSSTPDGKGYWLLASDGGIFAFGDAQFYGSTGSKTINGWAVGISSTPDGKGYYIQSSDGAVFAYGDAKYQGRLFYPPPSLSLSANPTPVWASWPVKLSWSTGNSDQASGFVSGCNVAEGLTSLNSSQSFTAPTTLGTCNYTLTVIGAGGTDDIQVPIQVIIPPPTVSITAVPQTITQGDGTILEWSSTNASGVTISVTDAANGASVLNSTNTTASGSIPGFGSNLSQGTYKVNISATNAGGFTATSNAELTVLPTPNNPSSYTGAGNAPSGSSNNRTESSAGHLSLPIHFDDTFWFWPQSSGGYTSLSVDITPQVDGSPQGYFFSNEFYFQNNSGSNTTTYGTGYLGLQTETNNNSSQSIGKGDVFSIWGATAVSGSQYSVNTNESGTGLSARNSYNWVVGRTYTLTVQYMGNTSTQEKWQALVKDDTTNTTSVIGNMQVPANYGMLTNESASFHERYNGPISSCSDLNLSEVKFTNPRINGNISPTGYTNYLPIIQPCTSNYYTVDVPGGFQSVIGN